ncbi:PCRF domain-containing protein, partial [Pelagibacteraceae bacterium]|nr:PCRF domain-containing protein [Pelagibacteraceae bacterium]
MINFDKQFTNILNKYNKIENSLNHSSLSNSNELVKLNREYADLTPIVEKISEYKKEKKEVKSLSDLIKDSDQE